MTQREFSPQAGRKGDSRRAFEAASKSRADCDQRPTLSGQVRLHLPSSPPPRGAPEFVRLTVSLLRAQVLALDADLRQPRRLLDAASHDGTRLKEFCLEFRECLRRVSGEL